jgi:hypothetical protein
MISLLVEYFVIGLMVVATMVSIVTILVLGALFLASCINKM